MKTVLYPRVSTRDKEQDVEDQLAQLRDFCQRSGWRVAREYIGDKASRNPEQSLRRSRLARLCFRFSKGRCNHRSGFLE